MIFKAPKANKRRRAVVILAALSAVALTFAFVHDRPQQTGQWLTRQNLQTQTIHVGRFDLRYVRKGQGSTVILLHGIVSSIYTWSEVINLLAEKFDVVAVDLPGFGESSQPADLKFDEYAPTLASFMRALDIQKADVVGNSMGGAIALLLASQEPDRVGHVVLLDSAGVNMTPRDQPFLVKLLASRTAEFLAENLPVRRLLTRATLGHLIHDRSRVTDERVNEYVAPTMRPTALASARSLVLSRIDTGLSVDLRGVRASTLVIWGRFDPWMPLSHADQFVAGIKGARKVVLETGHMPQEEQPADVARIIGEFLLS